MWCWLGAELRVPVACLRYNALRCNTDRYLADSDSGLQEIVAIYEHYSRKRCSCRRDDMIHVLFLTVVYVCR